MGSPERTHILLNEIAFSSMVNYIEQNCSAAVLFTGYHGDKVWDINTPDQYLGEELKLSSRMPWVSPKYD